MKKFVSFVMILCLAPLLTGCGLFGIGGGKTYDGSEAFYEAHPEYNNPQSYQQGGDLHSDGN